MIAEIGCGARRLNGPERKIEGSSRRMLTVTLHGLEGDGIVHPVMPPARPSRSNEPARRSSSCL
ncbi:winged helix-turn-helix transcriptional regulator [uncultured Thermomonospora sp.]|uniref:winged helix-turn-helix transcriptional regulator n=1 Tax=uncultured Thermomonospora sp. TaxID=671175 RepID=UPI00259B5B14|nr:winged helix-turn-helix transcriptional regulator [uncultured Thermomonospora sp.]